MIYVEDRLVKLNGVVLPGLVKSIEVKETAKIDEQEVEGSAVKPKQAVGYEDAKVTIELILDDTPNQTMYQCLEVIRALFRQPGQSVPKPISIICEDTARHGVSEVLFKGLSHKREAKKGQLSVSLEFWEYIPQTIKVAKKSGSGSSGGAKGGSKGGAGSRRTSQMKAAKTAIDVRNTALDALKSVSGSMFSKFDKSPSVDDADTGGISGAVSQLPE